MAGFTLSSRDISGMNAVLDACRESSPAPGIPVGAIGGLKALIPCDELSINGQDWTLPYHFFKQVMYDHLVEKRPDRARPYDGVGRDDVYWDTFWDGECSRAERIGDYGSVTMVSDFLSTRQMRAVRRCSMFFRFGYLREMMAVWPAGPGCSVHLLLWRSPGRDFSERERFILSLLRPHLAAAYWRSAAVRPSLPRLTHGQLKILELAGRGMTNRQIASTLQRSEGTVRTQLGRVYKHLEVTSRTAAVVKVGAAGGPGFLAPTHEHAQPIFAPAVSQGERHSLLTQRQLQIVRLVEAGFTNLEIAERLALSEGTVRTHLNNIYSRLDVTSRTAAVRRVFGDSAAGT